MTTFNSIGFIGLGVMGEPMCRNLGKKAGVPVTAFDLVRARLEAAREDGVIPGATLAAAAAADLVFLSLPGGDEVRAVADQLLPLVKTGQTVVDTSTAPVALARELAEQFATKDVAFADAPIARTRQAARDGTLSVMVGATPALFAKLEPVIACFAADITHCGPVGTGQIAKIMNNMVLFEIVTALAEALTIGRRAGIADEVLFDVISKGSGDSFALRNHGRKAMLPGKFPKRAFSAKYALKDLSYALQLASETGVDAAGARNVDRLLRAAIDHGIGDGYFPVLLAELDDALKPELPEGD
jgi:3-hydroxyisobutyrate dehydrogenase-like beta-hydroxyacid dehydrogenase